MRVQVAINLALDRLFTYAVPLALEKKLAVGQLLSVPFGNRTARGFAMAFGGELPEGAKIREIASIVDETPFFTPALLKLVRSLAAYCGAPVESVLKAALPAAVVRPGAHAREELYVDAVAGADTSRLTKRQKWLCDQIVRLGGGWLSPLCAELSTSPATLRNLAKLGVATVESRTRRRDPLANRANILPTSPLRLNDEQAAALAEIGSGVGTTLLYGVTGSGKTEVYLQAIAAELAAGRGAIVMVPEIALTPQTVRRFAARFGDRVAVLHSALSDGERYDEWHRIRSGAASVVVGPRSAVFAPVRNLGLIVVDEEHEPSYKQDETPRYHARDAAVLRGAIEGARVVLGSATPSFETWMNVRRGKYRLATMRRRAGAGTLPLVHVIDRTAEKAAGGGGIFSPELLAAIQLRLDRHEQTILFLNRRGYARSVTCESCQAVVTCPACDIAYTYHRADDCLRCHICGRWIPTPAQCPECGSKRLDFVGIGTQRAELALKKCFPMARVLRMDADSTSRRHSHDDILGAFRRFEADILIGTQMIAKGLDFPNVTLVGVLNADSALNMPDFRASERTYQLLAQVAGRAGRAQLPGEVFVQAYDPSASAIEAVAHGTFDDFAAAELKIREEMGFPPFCHLAAVNLRSGDASLVAGWADMYSKSLARWASSGSLAMRVAEAVPSVIEKADGQYRWQIVLRSPRAAELVRAWRWAVAVRPPPHNLRVDLDVDAYSLM